MYSAKNMRREEKYHKEEEGEKSAENWGIELRCEGKGRTAGGLGVEEV